MNIAIDISMHCAHNQPASWENERKIIIVAQNRRAKKNNDDIHKNKHFYPYCFVYVKMSGM